MRKSYRELTDIVENPSSDFVLADVVEKIDSLKKPHKEVFLYTKLLNNDEIGRNPSAVKLLGGKIHSSNVRAESLYTKAEALSMEDELTGLGNRRNLELELKKELAFSYRNPNRVFSVATFDIDDFRDFNNRYGHGGGDGVLKTLGNIISDSARDSDSMFRISGDEFFSLYRNARTMGASLVAYKLSHRVANTKIIFRDERGERHKKSIKISTGVTEINQHNPVWLLYGKSGRQIVRHYVGEHSGLKDEINRYIGKYSIKQGVARQRNIPDKKRLKKDIRKIGDFAKDYIVKNNLDMNNVSISKIAINWVMKSADDLAYYAKRNGKNCVAYRENGKNMIYTPA